ncbi:integrase family protein [Stenotrophomonas maltophilia]|nr:integrase family protein [Stenotrophomonas maltophilia]
MSKQRYRLNDRQLRALNINQRPAIDPQGKTVIEQNPDPKPYRFMDGTPGAPTGFGVYVGKSGNSFEVRKRAGDRLVRVSLGSVADMTIIQAHEKARAQLAYIVETGGESPKRRDELERRANDIRNITVRTCMERYIEKMQAQVDAGKRKAISAKAVQNSLARLERPEVNLSDVQVRDLTIDQITNGWNALRTSAMLKSNRIPEQTKANLAKKAKWWALTVEEYAELGLSGKYIQRTKSAGIEAVEHTFADLNRSIELVLRQERLDALRENRAPIMQHNPLQMLFEMDLWRGAKEKREHYRKAQVRNPLAKDDGSLPNVLKTLVFRRNLQNKHNAVAVDYLLLTLLWGARRNEAAKLQWYVKASKEDIANESVSWVWLAKTPGEINPTTKRPGSQVFFHDTKGGEVRFLPVAYFAERVLMQRWQDAMDVEAHLPIEMQKATQALLETKKRSGDFMVIAKAQREIYRVEQKAERCKWVFPARSTRSKEGHYSDSKSIIKNVRVDAGMLDLRKDIDVGLTPHDLRRTLGRFAEALLSGRIVSDMLNHKVSNGSASVTDLYNEQEWGTLREAFAKVEEVMISTSPRVWNVLKGTDKPFLDESNDEAPTIHSGMRARKSTDEDE